MNTDGRENILMNSSNNKLHSLSQFERQLCGIQGKMFELSAKKNYSSKEFIDFYMQSQTAKFFDLPYVVNVKPLNESINNVAIIKK